MKSNKLIKNYLKKVRDKLQQNVDIMELNGDIEEKHIRALLVFIYGSTFQNAETMKTLREIRLNMDFKKLDLNPEF